MLFINLSCFTGQGGIERFNRAFSLALTGICSMNREPFGMVSLMDRKPDTRYISGEDFNGFSGNKPAFVLQAIGRVFHEKSTLITGHLNLAFIGVLFKLVNPKGKLIVIVHGIEAWGQLKGMKRRVLMQADRILSVSNFTAGCLQRESGIPVEKISVFPNTLDPYIRVPSSFNKPQHLVEKYRLHQKKIILTLARIRYTEQYKGYDKVIEALATLKKEGLDFHYLLCGKYDAREKNRLDSLIAEKGLISDVTLPGFIDDHEVTAHYLLADVYAMPSKKEGFGIVFIEAAACGVPVIAGNRDGSVDAVFNEHIGTLTDPDDVQQIADAIKASLTRPDAEPEKKNRQQHVVETFGFDRFKQRLADMLYPRTDAPNNGQPGQHAEVMSEAG